MDAARRAGKMKASGGTGWMNEHAIIALQHSKKIMPLLMEQIENDYMCSELRKFFANVKVTTLTSRTNRTRRPQQKTSDRLAQASHITR